jgi:hypothetical protein
MPEQISSIPPHEVGMIDSDLDCYGLIMPPVGVVLNVVCGSARIDIDSAIRRCMASRERRADKRSSCSASVSLRHGGPRQ